MEHVHITEQSAVRSRPLGLGVVVSLGLLALGALLVWGVSGGPLTIAPPGNPAANPAPADTTPPPPGQQTNTGGQVTVAVTWAGASGGPVFTIAMDTHSVPLDGYDLRQLAVLRTGQGVEVTPSGWDAPAGGHHRKGTLTFPTTTGDGQPVFTAATREVVLVIRDVAGVPERTFRWQP
jgi:hypothetical protein